MQSNDLADLLAKKHILCHSIQNFTLSKIKSLNATTYIRSNESYIKKKTIYKWAQSRIYII